MVCLEIQYLHYILEYIIYIFYKILDYSIISQQILNRFQNTKILLVWSFYYTNQQKNKHQSVGFYLSYKIN